MVPVNTAYRGYMLEYLLNDTACEVLVVDATLLDRVLESADRLESLETLVVAGADGAVETPWRTVAFESLPGEPVATDPDVTLRRRELRRSTRRARPARRRACRSRTRTASRRRSR